jgi:uncharacterized protein DUF3553
MKLKPGVIISHSSAPQWGSGKVLEVAADKITIIFNDGEIRKIKESHLDFLQPADPASFQEPVKKTPRQRTTSTSSTSSKSRQAGQGLPKVLSQEFAFTYPKQLRKQFAHDTRGQIEAWQREYSFLFDVRDASLATSYQGRSLSPHFLEWYAAIKMYETLGYYSLNKNYECPDHAAKQGLLRRLLSEQAFRFLVNPHPVYGEGHCPELLLYKPDLSDWCFCTVKGPKDTLQLEQARYWQELIAVSDKKIMQVCLKETTT